MIFFLRRENISFLSDCGVTVLQGKARCEYVTGGMNPSGQMDKNSEYPFFIKQCKNKIFIFVIRPYLLFLH